MRLFGQLRNKYAELPELEDPKSDASSAQTGRASSSGARDAVHVEKRFSPPSTISTGTNTLPLLLSPLLPPVTLKHALFCGLTTSLAHSSHMDESNSDGGERMFAYHSNTRNYIKRTDAPSAPAADSKHIDYKTEWECEQGIIWPKIVNYALQCSKGHNLTPLPWPISSVTSNLSAFQILCRLCGQDPSIGFPKTAASSLKSASACPYCDYVVCHACISAVAPHVQEPPQPPPPSLLHRGVRLDVVRQFKQNWGHVYGRWTTEQVCQQVIKPLTARSRGSFCDELAATSPHLVGAATCFVSHTWSYSFADVIDAILLYFEPSTAAQQADVILWIDFFCDSQHARLPSWPPPDVVKNSKWFMDNFADLISTIGSVLMVMQPWNAPLTLTRCWCVLELGHCARKNCKFDVAFTAEERARFLKAIRHDATCLFDVIANVNSMKSSCSRPEDRIAILNGISVSIGFTKLDRMVFEVLDRWQLQALSSQAHMCEAEGAEHASWFNSLGRMHYEQGRIRDAERYFSKAAASASSSSDCSEEVFLMAQTNVAVVRYAIARDSEQSSCPFTVKQAHKLLTDVVISCRTRLQHHNTLLCTAVLQLADLHRDMGDIDAAQDLYHEALQYARSLSHEVFAIVAQVGLALIAQEKALYKEALFMFAEAHKKCEVAAGADHPVTILCRVRQALCLLEVDKGSISHIWKGCASLLPTAFMQLCGCDIEKEDTRVFHPARPGTVHSETATSAQDIGGGGATPSASGIRGHDQFSETSKFLCSDPAYAMLADSFERCTRTLGSKHPQTKCTHAWLQVVEAMNRQQPAKDVSCYSQKSPVCVSFALIFCCLFIVFAHGIYTAIQYLNEREIWRIDGNSEIVALPMSIVMNASAGKFLHAVGAAFRFNGRVVHCGTACSPPLPIALSVDATVAVIDMGSCDFGTKICLAQRAGASGVVVISNNSGHPIYRMEGATPCDVRIAAVMVSVQDGHTLRNATSLSVYSGFHPAHFISAQFNANVVLIGLWVGLPLMICSMFNCYQIITFRLMLRRIRFSHGHYVAFFQLASRKVVQMLLVVASSLLIAFNLPVKHNSAPDAAEYNDGEKSQFLPEFQQRAFLFTELAMLMITFVFIASLVLQATRACARRRKLSVAASFKYSAAAAPGHLFQELISPSDGNCLFHSFAAALSHDQSIWSTTRRDRGTGHATIRNEIVDHLRTHCDELFVGNTGLSLRDYVEAETKGVSFDRYCDTMSQPATSPLDSTRWGGLPEIIVFAHMNRVAVIVHDGSHLYGITPPGRVVAVTEEHPAELHISYRGGNHYNYLLPTPTEQI